tara:strand:+ start:7195 stop:8415 length:1221 start_codon:yes stop_codon:yes gene_type:complete
MKNLSKLTFYTILIRVINLSLRLSLIVILGKFYSLEFVGIYGLILALVGICVQMIPFEFYSYTTLEILEKNEMSTNKVLANHFFFIFLMGCICSPIFYATYGYFSLDYSLFFYISFVLVFEILARELSRVLVALEHPIATYIIASIHSSLWIFVIIIGLFQDKLFSIEEVLVLWGSSGIIAAITGLYFVKQKVSDKIFHFNFLSIDWIKNGIFFTFPLLIGSLSHAMNQYVGRFFLGNNISLSDISVFTIYFQISALVLITVEVLQNIYIPTYVRNNSMKKSNNNYEYAMLIIIAFIALIITFLQERIFIFINPELLNDLDTMHMLLLAMSALSFAAVLRNRLYVKRLKYKIMYSYFIAMIVSLIGNSVFVPRYGAYGSASTMFISGLFLCLSIYLFDKFNRPKIV